MVAELKDLESRRDAERAAGDHEAADATAIEIENWERREDGLQRMKASAGVTVSLGLHAFPSGEARFEAVPLLAVARPFSSLVDHLLATTPSEDEERVSVLKAARDMLEYRKLKPVKVQVWYDDAWLGATANVERGDPLSHAALWAESWPPREFTMRVVTDEVLAALEAPRCLLAIIDPGGFLCNALLPIDEVALHVPP